MKENRIISYFTKEWNEHRKQYFFVIGILITGITIGGLASVFQSETTEIQSLLQPFITAFPLQGANHRTVFSLSILQYLAWGFWIWCCGWSVWLFPFGVLQIFLKGFRLGFTIASLLGALGAKGVLLAFSALFFQNIILLPILCFFMVYQMEFLSDRRYLRRVSNRSMKKQVYGQHFFYLGVFLLFLVLCAMIEGYLVPVILRPICRILGH